MAAPNTVFFTVTEETSTSKAVMELLRQYGFHQNFPRVGMPSDNAWSESFFAAMKKELIHRTHYETKEFVRAAAVFEYI